MENDEFRLIVSLAPFTFTFMPANDILHKE